MASENCAVGADSKLKDANDIRWYNSGDDETPIAPATGKLRLNDRVSITMGPSSKTMKHLNAASAVAAVVVVGQ
ncbi:hypothetical protein F5148DRAFT_1289397 [Russula earlei]|uniref:Uncharacterized protein n=1 Tax=Russula earlei TaxID=71964 RepID=A0ACC0TXN5_9AGAM|nr:hypothetical protein F5148DRAFT_1289397 [Russula earlei]